MRHRAVQHSSTTNYYSSINSRQQIQKGGKKKRVGKREARGNSRGDHQVLGGTHEKGSQPDMIILLILWRTMEERLQLDRLCHRQVSPCAWVCHQHLWTFLRIVYSNIRDKTRQTLTNTLLNYISPPASQTSPCLKCRPVGLRLTCRNLLKDSGCDDSGKKSITSAFDTSRRR